MEQQELAQGQHAAGSGLVDPDQRRPAPVGRQRPERARRLGDERARGAGRDRRQQRQPDVGADHARCGRGAPVQGQQQLVLEEDHHDAQYAVGDHDAGHDLLGQHHVCAGRQRHQREGQQRGVDRGHHADRQARRQHRVGDQRDHRAAFTGGEEVGAVQLGRHRLHHRHAAAEPGQPGRAHHGGRVDGGFDQRQRGDRRGQPLPAGGQQRGGAAGRHHHPGQEGRHPGSAGNQPQHAGDAVQAVGPDGGGDGAGDRRDPDRAANEKCCWRDWRRSDEGAGRGDDRIAGKNAADAVASDPSRAVV